MDEQNEVRPLTVAPFTEDKLHLVSGRGGDPSVEAQLDCHSACLSDNVMCESDSYGQIRRTTHIADVCPCTLKPKKNGQAMIERKIAGRMYRIIGLLPIGQAREGLHDFNALPSFRERANSKLVRELLAVLVAFGLEELAPSHDKDGEQERRSLANVFWRVQDSVEEVDKRV